MVLTYKITHWRVQEPFAICLDEAVQGVDGAYNLFLKTETKMLFTFNCQVLTFPSSFIYIRFAPQKVPGWALRSSEQTKSQGVGVFSLLAKNSLKCFFCDATLKQLDTVVSLLQKKKKATVQKRHWFCALWTYSCSCFSKLGQDEVHGIFRSTPDKGPATFALMFPSCWVLIMHCTLFRSCSTVCDVNKISEQLSGNTCGPKCRHAWLPAALHICCCSERAPKPKSDCPPCMALVPQKIRAARMIPSAYFCRLTSTATLRWKGKRRLY